MNLTFKGFLRNYCCELTELETSNLRKLLAEALTNAPAAAEALMCFAASQNKADYLAKLAQDTSLENQYREVAQQLSSADSLESWLSSDAAPTRYNKVWRAYLSKRNAIDADRRVIALMRDKTLASIDSTGRTIYGLCTQLGLNKGNVYAYLNAGDVSKVSRSTARRLMEAASAPRP